MKKISITISLALLIAVGFTSCKKVKDALFPTIDVNLPAFQVTVPPIPFVLPNEMSLGTFTMHFNLDSIIRANTAGAFGANAASTVKIKQMVINVSNADNNNNLSNFESARFTFASNANSTEAEIMSIQFPDTYTSTMTVVPENSPELVSYLSGTELKYTLYGKARRTTSKSLNFTVTITLSAK